MTAPQPTRSEGLAARDAAVRLLSEVLDARQPLDAALEADATLAGLPARDRAFARAIVATALRRHGTLTALLADLIEKPPRHSGRLIRVLETAAAQLLYMGVPDHAAVSMAMEQVSADDNARHFRSLANAVLRRIARENEELIARHESPASDTPEWLWRRWVATYGEATAGGIAAAHRLEPSLDVSVRADPEVWAERLGGVALATGSVRAVVSGDIAALPGYGDGAWWVQDAAAALPARLLRDVRGLRVVDLCAAPGGKTAALAAAGASVTAVDISPRRLQRLAANLKRLSLAADLVAADALAWTPPAPVDAVLLDAPCTATGTIRRHPDVAWLKRPEDIASLAALQSRMIERAIAMLKPGGLLLYCTCSLEAEEGEAHLGLPAVRELLTVEPVVAAEVGGLAAIVAPTGTVRTLPTHLPNEVARLSGLDGFFMMRLRKRG